MESHGPRTNIVVVEVTRDGATAGQLRDRLAREGLLALPFDARRLRFITYRGVTQSDIGGALAIVERAMRETMVPD